MTQLDLFSGIGGFALACRWAGIETIGFSEIDPYCCRVLEKNFPGVKNYGDIKRYHDWPDLHPDLVTGGPPCQPASLAGKRRGPKDDRWLWPEALECVARFKPTACLFENPDDLLTLDDGVAIEDMLSKLESFGYEVAPPFVIPACAIDAGHERMRVWIVAHLDCGRKLQSGGVQPNERGWTGDEDQQAAANTSSGGRNGRGAASGDMEKSEENQRRGLLEPARLPEPSTDLAGERLAQREKQLPRQCAALTGSPWPVTAETDFSLLREVHGVSAGLDRHRRARIKALGNSIVPQIAFQILKAMNLRCRTLIDGDSSEVPAVRPPGVTIAARPTIDKCGADLTPGLAQ